MGRSIFHGYVVFSRLFYVDLLNALVSKLSSSGLQRIFVENIFVIFLLYIFCRLSDCSCRSCLAVVTSLHSPINYTQEATRDRQMKYKKHERVDQSYKSICQQSERKKEFQAQLGFLKSLDQVSLLCFVNCVTRAPLLDFER